MLNLSPGILKYFLRPFYCLWFLKINNWLTVFQAIPCFAVALEAALLYKPQTSGLFHLGSCEVGGLVRSIG